MNTDGASVAGGDAEIRWNEAGLAPAVVQHHETGQVLMLGWMNREALRRTVETGEVHFWSRRRAALWKKGETSGNFLALRSIRTDCDRDALLVRADPAGPTCHTGVVSCFFEPLEATPTGDPPDSEPDNRPGSRPDSAPPDPSGPTGITDGRKEGASAGLGTVLDRLAGIVAERAEERPEGSYTAALLAAGVGRTAQKVGEEGVETALAAAAGSEEELVGEAADLLYHLLVALRSRGVPPGRVAAELQRRFPPAKPGTGTPPESAAAPDSAPAPRSVGSPRRPNRA